MCYNENSYIIEFNIWYKTLKSKSYIFYNIILLNLYIMVTITLTELQSSRILFQQLNK